VSIEESIQVDIRAVPGAELWDLLQHTVHAILRLKEQGLRKTGISSVQADVLAIVKNTTPPVTPSQISRRLFREPHTVSELLNRMEKEGLVEKAKDMKRRNQVRVVLTEKGEEAYQSSQEIEVTHRILSSLTPDERDNLRKYLGIMLDKTLQDFAALTLEQFLTNRFALSQLGTDKSNTSSLAGGY